MCPQKKTVITRILAVSFVVPPSNFLKDKLISSTQLALRQACRSAKAGSLLNLIGKSIQKVAKQKGFRVIKNLCSHGVGRGLHEKPKEIPGNYEPRDTRKLHHGLVITIEPFLSLRINLSVNLLMDGPL